MKFFAYCIIFILMTVLVFFDYKNAQTTVSYFMFNDVLVSSVLPLIVTIAFLGGLIAGAAYGWILIINTKKHALAQNKRVEKFSVDQDSANLKIKTLEAKVKTLEAALDKALKQE